MRVHIKTIRPYRNGEFTPDYGKPVAFFDAVIGDDFVVRSGLLYVLRDGRYQLSLREPGRPRGITLRTGTLRDEITAAAVAAYEAGSFEVAA